MQLCHNCTGSHRPHTYTEITALAETFHAYRKAEGDCWIKVCPANVSECIYHRHHHTTCMHAYMRVCMCVCVRARGVCARAGHHAR